MRSPRSRHGRIGFVVIGALALASLLGLALGGDPNQHHFDLPRAADGGPPLPSAGHWLGTDPLHRDVLARLCAGARISLVLAVLAGALATVIGTLFGVLAAVTERFASQTVARVLMRGLDALFAFPSLLLVTAIGTLLGGTSLVSMIAVLGFTGWTGLARIVYAKASAVLREDFVLASRALGATPFELAKRHVLPNVLPTAFALGTSTAGGMILAESVLSYLNVGLPPPDASWGRMLQEAEGFVTTRPLLVFAPATAILLTMLGFHHLGEAWLDTSARRRSLVPWDVAIAVGVFAATALLPPGKLRPPDAARVTSGAAEPRQGGTLRLATAFSIRTMDPALASDENAIMMGRMVFGQLLAQDDAGNVTPGIVEDARWETPKLARLRVRPGVEFQDGAPLTAGDLKRSIERALGPKVASGRASEFAGIVGFDAFRKGDAPHLAGVRAPDALTLEIELAEVDATFFTRLSLAAVAPVCPSTPPPGVATPAELCGAGPFRIESLEPDGALVIVRNLRYFEPGLPYLDRIELTMNVRTQAQRYRFERGEFDVLREVTSHDAGLFRADPRWSSLVRTSPRFRISAIYLDTRRPPFDDVHLRRAVSAAIDASVLSTIRPEVRELHTVVPEGMPFRPEDAVGRRFDRARALEEMREAGFAFDPETGAGGLPGEVAYVTVPNTLEQHAAEIYAEQLAAIGIRVKLHLLTFQAYLAHVRSSERAPMGWAGWQADYADPVTFFDPSLMPTTEEGSHNYSGFASPELAELIGASRTTLEPRARTELFRRAEEIVLREAPWIPTMQPESVEVVQPWVAGYEPDPVRVADFTRVHLLSEGSR